MALEDSKKMKVLAGLGCSSNELPSSFGKIKEHVVYLLSSFFVGLGLMVRAHMKTGEPTRQLLARG